MKEMEEKEIVVYQIRYNYIGRILNFTQPLWCGMIGRAFIDDCVDNETAKELVWHLTNWTHWADDKDDEYDDCIECVGGSYFPTEDDLGYTNDDIFFKLGEKWYAAKTSGWAEFDTQKECIKYLCANSLQLL